MILLNTSLLTILYKMKVFSDIHNCDENSISGSLKEAIRDIVKREEYVTYKLNIGDLPQSGGNYLATLVRVEIKGQTVDGDKETNIIVKNILQGDHLEFFSLSNIHSRELFFYNELSKMFTKLQDEAKIPVNERYKMAKCYEESNSEFIILENLSRNGFVTPDRMDPVSFSFAKLTIQQMARLHALSLVLKNKRPQYFDSKIKPLRTPVQFNTALENCMKNFCNISTECLNNDMKKKTETFIATIGETLKRHMLDTSIGCLCHGDLKSTNILKKINGNEVSEVVFIDYQMSFYGNPLMDIMYFIFSATDQPFRRNHLETIKNLYYDTIKTFLGYFEMDVEDHFPRKIYEQLYKDSLTYGLIIGICFLPLSFAASDDIPDFSKASPEIFKVDPRLKSRLDGIIEDFTQWGYL
ncbi:uncharacterized protein LOC131851519 [Achroia grisella]|uniref:uncharacterized protein LOC131851519 n=1 Tax=Achroia grisella TaxID=688607 RepID=UPI0027D26D74|nr:uncharacterized protein LOC131851519 [Achroia grisella]